MTEEPEMPPETSQTMAAKASSRPKKGFVGLAIITLVISVAAGTGSYYLGWPYITKQWHRFTDLERQLEEIRAVVKQHPEVSVSTSAASETRMRSLLIRKAQQKGSLVPQPSATIHCQ